MAISKVLRVNNVGRFSNLTGQGDVAFRRLTLVYGENGYGKSTVAGILRSLKTGNPVYLAERATLGATDAQRVEVLLSGNVVAKFEHGNWSNPHPEIEIFDSVFVRENVYAGDSVENEHRRNLYEVVVGEPGVALRNKIDALDSEGRVVAAQTRRLEDELAEFKHAPFTLEEFLKLEAPPDVAERIRDATAKLNAMRNAKSILRRPSLQGPRFPVAPRNVLVLLGTTVQQVAAAAVDRVKAHISNRLGSNGEAWIRTGLGFGAGQDCPFCGQNTASVELIESFSLYFSHTYDEKIVDVRRALNQLDQEFGPAAWARVERLSLENDACILSWAEQADLHAAKIPLDRLQRSWEHLYLTVGDALRRKLATPAEVSTDLTVVEAAIQDYEESLGLLTTAQGAIEEANGQIDHLKQEAASEDEKAVEAELRKLRNGQIRQDPRVQELSRQLEESWARKEELARAKDAAKEDLQNQVGEILQRYEASINAFLTRFGASFRMVGTRPAFPGGKATATYKIQIREQAVDLGDSRTQSGKVCFRTALSTGDRSTLALAFFLAKLEHEADLDQKVVVFDDPLSSLDCFRANCTQQEIRRVATKAKQVVVLSHDPFFLKGLYDEEETAPKALHIVGRSGSHQILEWDIDAACESQSHRDYFLLKSFLKDGPPKGIDLATIGSRVRPYVEDYLRRKYPEEFRGLVTLGACVKKIEEAPSSDGVGAFKPRVEELKAINEFSRKFMHSDARSTQVTQQELESYARRAIALVQAP